MLTEVYFRVDANAETGGGHLSRCLTLAKALRARGASVEAIAGRMDEQYAATAAADGYKVIVLPQTKNSYAGGDNPEGLETSREIVSSGRGGKKVLIVDHYKLDQAWESQFRQEVDKIVVIDDLADRPHDCDLLLDQAYGEDGKRYAGLIPRECIGLFGSNYALLRPEFARLRGERRFNSLTVDRGLIFHLFFGSSDRSNTVRYGSLLLRSKQALEVRAAVGPGFQATEALERLRRASNGRLSWRIVGDSMAEHMAACDVAVGAPGHATWERACLGLPAAYVAISPVQVPILERLARDDFCVYLGTDSELEDEEFVVGVERFSSDREILTMMREKSFGAIDGLGADRVADAILD